MIDIEGWPGAGGAGGGGGGGGAPGFPTAGFPSRASAVLGGLEIDGQPLI